MGEGHELAAHGIARESHRFERISAEKRAIFFFAEAEDNRPYTDTILVFEQSAAYFSLDR